MSKYFWILALCVSLLFISGCQQNDNPSNNFTTNQPPFENTSLIVEEVYAKLDQKTQKSIDNIDDAQIRTIIAKSSNGNISNDDYINREVLAIEFPYKDTNTINLIVWVDKDNYDIIGYGYSD